MTPAPADVDGPWRIDLSEVSGLCERAHPSGGARQLLAISDRLWSIAAVSLTASGVGAQKVHGLKGVLPTQLTADGSSQFEGIAADSAGRVFVLHETRSLVLALDAALEKVEHIITLHHDWEHAGPGEPATSASGGSTGTSKGANKRGEGLLLLQGGHVLVAKQASPVMLIEFGPAGDPPLGYAPWSALGDAPFALPKGPESTFEALASWSLDATTVQSINDLAIDSHARLHFVSSKSHCIGRVADVLTPGEPLVATRTWQLPELPAGEPAAPAAAAAVVPHPGDAGGAEAPDGASEPAAEPGQASEPGKTGKGGKADDTDRAEGLVFSQSLGWLVACDHNLDAPNLHRVPRSSS